MDTRTIRILVIEDDPRDGRYLWELLRQAERESKFPSFDMHQCDRLSTSRDLLKDHEVDLIILDLNLPDATGLEAIHSLYRESPTIPIIVWTGLQQKNQALEAVRAGAQDYLIKGEVEASNLVRTLLFSMERGQKLRALHEERLQAEEHKNLYHSYLLPDAEGVIIVDQNGIIQFMNASAELLLCQNARDLIGKEIWFPVSAGVSEVLDIDHGDERTIQAELSVEAVEWGGELAFQVILRELSSGREIH
jgi:DNA-binding NarL/FixJ family response regulator